MDFVSLIPTARTLIHWSQEDLGQAAGLSTSTIANLETRRQTPQQDTLDRIREAFLRQGVEFLPDGVRRPSRQLIPLKGRDWFVDLLADIAKTLGEGDEVLIFGGDNRISANRPDVIEGFRKIRNAGIRMREMVEHGNLYLMGPEREYRWIPSAHFRNFVTVIYGDKVCNDFGDSGTLLINKDWAEAERHKFEFMWESAAPVKGNSIADIRY